MPFIVLLLLFFFLGTPFAAAEDNQISSTQNLSDLLQEGFSSWTQPPSPPASQHPDVQTVDLPQAVEAPALTARQIPDQEISAAARPPALPDKESVPANEPVPPTPFDTSFSPESINSALSETPGLPAEGRLSALSAFKPDVLDPLSLEDIVGYALKNNFEILSMEARAKGSRWDNAGAYALYTPSIDFTFAQGAERSEPGAYNDASGDRVSVTTHNRRDRVLSIRQPLLDLAVLADILKTSETVDLAETEKIEAKETTVFATVSAVLKLLQAQKTIALFDSYTIQLKTMAERMRARLEEGGATTADLDRIESRLSVAEASRLEALSSYGTTLAELKRLTGIVPAQIMPPRHLIPEIPPTPQDAALIAWHTNPSYLAAIKKIDVARRDRDKSFAGALPKVSVEYSDSFTYNAGGAAHGSPIDGVYPTQKDERIMLVAKWSLTGGTTLTSGMSGLQKMEEMSLKAKDIRARIEQGLTTAYNGLNAARQRIAILERNQETDQRVVQELEEQFLIGGRSLFEILDGLDRLHQTRLALTNALFAQALSAFQIRMQMGEIVRAVLDGNAGHDDQ